MVEYLKARPEGVPRQLPEADEAWVRASLQKLYKIADDADKAANIDARAEAWKKAATGSRIQVVLLTAEKLSSVKSVQRSSYDSQLKVMDNISASTVRYFMYHLPPQH